MNILSKNNFKKDIITFSILVMINLVGFFFFQRFDLTKDKRYTLSNISLEVLNQVKNPLSIKVYLDGNMPSEFVKLKQETSQLIEEFQAYNSNISVEFINPLEDKESSMDFVKSLYIKGLTPLNVTVEEKGKQSQTMLFPWAIAVYDNKEVNLPLLKNKMGASTSDKVLGSVQHLEYALTDAINKVINAKKKKIAFVRGNGQMPDVLMAKFLLATRENYFIAPITLDSVKKDPNRTLKILSDFDMAVINKPTIAFSDAQKQVLDQYIMKGGKTLWMIDQVAIEMDSLYNEAGSALAFGRDLNLNDMFFKYGVRINPVLVKDESATNIKLASGEPGQNTQLQDFRWKFAPLVFPISKNPIVNNLGGVKFDFANSIDTLKNGIKKTVLLQSSPYSKTVGMPYVVSLSSVSEETKPADYLNKGNLPMAVLLEGNFKSAYENRILAFEQNDFKNKSSKNQMIVIADGDIAKNQLDKNQMPVDLGYDQKTGNMYDNKDFLMNAVNYLLDDKGLLSLRTKTFELPLLDKEKVYDEYNFISVITIAIPLIIFVLFNIIFYFNRKMKYARK